MEPYLRLMMCVVLLVLVYKAEADGFQYACKPNGDVSAININASVYKTAFSFNAIGSCTTEMVRENSVIKVTQCPPGDRSGTVNILFSKTSLGSTLFGGVDTVNRQAVCSFRSKHTNGLVEMDFVVRGLLRNLGGFSDGFYTREPIVSIETYDVTGEPGYNIFSISYPIGVKITGPPETDILPEVCTAYSSRTLDAGLSTTLMRDGCSLSSGLMFNFTKQKMDWFDRNITELDPSQFVLGPVMFNDVMIHEEEEEELPLISPTIFTHAYAFRYFLSNYVRVECEVRICPVGSSSCILPCDAMIATDDNSELATLENEPGMIDTRDRDQTTSIEDEVISTTDSPPTKTEPETNLGVISLANDEINKRGNTIEGSSENHHHKASRSTRSLRGERDRRTIDIDSEIENRFIIGGNIENSHDIGALGIVTVGSTLNGVSNRGIHEQSSPSQQMKNLSLFAESEDLSSKRSRRELFEIPDFIDHSKETRANFPHPFSDTNKRIDEIKPRKTKPIEMIPDIHYQANKPDEHPEFIPEEDKTFNDVFEGDGTMGATLRVLKNNKFSLFNHHVGTFTETDLRKPGDIIDVSDVIAPEPEPMVIGDDYDENINWQWKAVAGLDISQASPKVPETIWKIFALTVPRTALNVFSNIIDVVKNSKIMNADRLEKTKNSGTLLRLLLGNTFPIEPKDDFPKIEQGTDINKGDDGQQMFDDTSEYRKTYTTYTDDLTDMKEDIKDHTINADVFRQPMKDVSPDLIDGYEVTIDDTQERDSYVNMINREPDKSDEMITSERETHSNDKNRIITALESVMEDEYI